MFGNLGTLPNEVFGDKDRQKPCPFFGSVVTDIECDEDGEDIGEHNGTRDIQAWPTG